MTAATVPADLPGEVRHRRVQVGDVQLATVEVGAPAAPAVLVAHGAGSSARFVASAFARPVLAQGWRLVTYDLRGHGASTPVATPAAHALDVQVADLAAVVAATTGPVVAVGGISLGAHAAVRWAARSGWRGGAVVACLPAWTGRRASGDGPHAAVAAEVRSAGVPAVLARLGADRDLPAWLRDTLVTDYARHDPAALAAALVALDGASAPDRAEVAALRAPLGVVGWPEDPGHPLEVARDWHTAAGRARLVTIRMSALDAGVDRLGRAALEAIGAYVPGAASSAPSS